MNPSKDSHRVVFIPSWVILLVIALGLFGLGAAHTERDANGQVLLLLPDVREMARYRESAQRHYEAMLVVDGEIAGLLSNATQDDLLMGSRQAQTVLERAVRLAKEIDQQEVPAAAAVVKEQLSSSALAYVEAARLASRWVSVPREETLNAALAALDAARAARQKLEDNPWIRTR